MIYSMTAFARSQTDFAGLHLVWELRSVNHRFLETHFRLPDSIRGSEHALRERLRKRLGRGKVDCTLRIEEHGGSGALTLNRDVLLKLLATIEQIRRDAPEAAAVNPIDLLKWPGVLADTGADPDALEQRVCELFADCVEALLAHRAREGAQLGTAIAERLDAIERLVGEVRALTASLAAELAARLDKRVRELVPSVEPARLEQEVALLVQRADVDEELDRLVIHVQEARSHLGAKGPHGRRLDFLTQELNREANTLGAKSVLAETSSRAVDLKVLIEQIREQVQNVE